MSAIDKSLSVLPYIKSMFGDGEIQTINKKFELFSDASLTKDKQIQRLSIVNEYDKHMEYSTNGGKISNMFFHQLMYNSVSDDKKRRLKDYRGMAQYAEVDSALMEICNEIFERDDQGEIVKCALRGDNNQEIQSLIEKEFQKFIQIFEFGEKGYYQARDFIVEGELFWENIVSAKKPELGIIGATRIAADRIDPLYYDVDNELVDSYILRPKQYDDYPYQAGKYSAQSTQNSVQQKQIIFLNDKQISYFYNNQWEENGRKFRVPILAKASRPYKQLSLIEDATIIYMLVRAPERLVFNIDTGNMPAAKSEQYLKRMMSQFWSKKTLGTDGKVANVYDPQSMLENYWFAKPREGNGSTVESIGGGNASPDNLEILNFFVQKLYKSLNVPLSRLNSDTVFSDGENITREELKFAEFIIQIQKRWASALRKAFIVHLKLKGKKLTEIAKKLDITSVVDPAHKEKIELNKVFKDNFDFKCWDLYDVVAEEIDNKIDSYIAQRESDKQNILMEINTIKEDLFTFTNQILTENDETLLTEIENKKHELLESLETLLEEVDLVDKDIQVVKDGSKSWWEQYDLKEEDIDVKFVEPSQFFALREQQIFQLKFDNYNNMSQNDMISNTFAQKVYLGWKDEQILANRAFLEKDAAKRWELAQIEANGPDFREKASEEEKGAESGEDFAGFDSLGGGGSLPAGGDTSLPDFGDMPEGGGETAGNELAGGEGEGGSGESSESEAPPKAPPSESRHYKGKVILESYADLLDAL